MKDDITTDTTDAGLRDAIATLHEQLRGVRDGLSADTLAPMSDDPAMRELTVLIAEVIGEARSSAEQLEMTNRELDYLIEQRSADLARVKSIAEHGSTAKSNFLAQMSHELRTPLNSIIGFAQLLMDSKKEALSERQQKQVDHILRGGHHLLGLINDVLDLSKIETGKLDLNMEPIEASVVIADCLEMISPQIEATGITFENKIDPDAELPGIHCDFLRVKQCLINLLNNACKYNKPGGKVWVEVEIFKGDQLRITVGDTGLGIPESRVHELFRPFSRLGREDSNVEGSGVGLALTRHLMNGMEGVLDFDSVEGEGSRFWFDLPIAEVPKTFVEDYDGEEVDAEMRAQGLVLYVEDIPSNVILMEDILSDYTDVELITAVSAEDGIAMALEQLPDLIIMDLNLGGMNGIDATRYIRSSPSIQNIPIIALTGDARKDTQKRCEEAGVDNFFSKPFNVNEFVEVLRAKLDQRLGKFL